MDRTWTLPPTYTYLSASNLGITCSKSTRFSIWRALPFKSTLNCLSLMAAQSSSDRAQSSETDQFWLRQIDDQQLQAKIRFALFDDSKRLIAAQVVMNGMRELIAQVDIESAENQSPVDIDLLIIALLSVADYLTHLENLPEDWPSNPSVDKWGQLATPLASHLIANILFNQILPVRYLVTRAHDIWGSEWGSSISELDKSRIGLEPCDLFIRATGSDIESMTDIIYAFWSQFLANNSVIVNDGFAKWAKLNNTSHSKAIEFLSISLAELQVALNQEKDGIWAFDSIRSHPILRLPDNSLAVLHMGWLFERGLGDPIAKDVRKNLERLDEQDSTTRSDSFRQALAQKFETDVENVLFRTFQNRRSKRENLRSRFWTEEQVKDVFSISGKRSQGTKIPDFLIQYGETWFIFEATFRETKAPIADESGSIEDLTEELDMFILQRKAKQLNSMIELLKRSADRLIGSPLSENAVFVPMIISGDYALPWILPVAAELPKWLEREKLLQQGNCLSMAVLTLRDLLYLEHVAEARGPRALDLIREWRESHYDSWDFNQFLYLKNIRLNLPRSVKKRDQIIFQELTKRFKANHRNG